MIIHHSLTAAAIIRVSHADFLRQLGQVRDGMEEVLKRAKADTSITALPTISVAPSEVEIVLSGVIEDGRRQIEDTHADRPAGVRNALYSRYITDVLPTPQTIIERFQRYNVLVERFNAALMQLRQALQHHNLGAAHVAVVNFCNLPRTLPNHLAA